MAFLNRLERSIVLLVALLAGCWLGAMPAAAQVFWTGDFDISEGDVNDTFTPLNNQRCAVVDDSNNLYISFFDNRNKVGLDNNFEIYFRRFVYNFGSPTITRATNAPNPSYYPSLATLNWGAGDAATAADSGRIYIAWQDARLFSVPTVGGVKSWTIFFRTFQSRGGQGFGPEIQVSPYDSVNATTAPVVTVGDSSRVFVVFPKVTDGDNDLYYAIYNSRTRTMGAMQPLVIDPLSNANLPSVAATRDGKVNVVWTDSRIEGRGQLFWKQFVPGTGWTADQQIVFNPGTSTSTQPSLIASRGGHLHLVWRDNRDGNNGEIYYKEYVPGVGWDASDTRLTVNTFSQLEPQVDVDPMDNVYVVWTDSRNGSSNPDIFYKERKGGVWASDMPLVWAATDTTNSVQHFPAITHDGIGQGYVAWTDERLPASLGNNREAFYKISFGAVTAVETTGRPEVARLLKNYPNPFNPRTTVEFTLPRDASTTLRVYDTRGRLVRTLIDSYVAAGRHSIRWNGQDDGGRSVSSGVYFLRLQADGQFLSRTVNLLK
jgi:hypothetical protein